MISDPPCTNDFALGTFLKVNFDHPSIMLSESHNSTE